MAKAAGREREKKKKWVWVVRQRTGFSSKRWLVQKCVCQSHFRAVEQTKTHHMEAKGVRALWCITEAPPSRTPFTGAAFHKNRYSWASLPQNSLFNSSLKWQTLRPELHRAARRYWCGRGRGAKCFTTKWKTAGWLTEQIPDQQNLENRGKEGVSLRMDILTGTLQIKNQS